ncbi:c-type cytochrome [Sulfurimonas sp.]
MKNIIVGLLTLVIVGLAVWTGMHGGAYNGGEHGKVIADIGNRQAATTAQPQEKSDREKENEELNALRQKAGNMAAFKVSDEYKSKCSSCHGVNGSGEQNGKKLMGPKLFGQSSDAIYTKLENFKSGRVENMVMKGLLIHMNEDDLKRFANEIGEFPARAEAVKSQN